MRFSHQHHQSAAFAVGDRKEGDPSSSCPISSRENTSRDNDALLLPEHVGLVGRCEEKSILNQAYQRVCCLVQQAPSEVILIEGKSGMGKTSLVLTTFLGQGNGNGLIDREGMGLLVHGKYDCCLSSPTTAPAVYDAILDAAKQLCMAVPESDYLEDVQGHLNTVISNADDRRLLLNLFPEMGILLQPPPDTVDVPQQQDGTNTSSSSEAAASNDGGSPNSSPHEFAHHEHAHKQFWKVLRTFLNAVASVHPIILFIDDLQSSTKSTTTDFLTAFVNDSTSTNILVIGAFRDGQFECRGLLDSRPKKEMRVTKIDLGPLREVDVNEIVSLATRRRQSEETLELANVVHQKTNGNPLYVWQFLDSLQSTGLLFYSYRTDQWEWEDPDTVIASRTNVSDNVAAELLATQKIARLSKQTQMVLVLAACLGHSFDRNVLETVFDATVTATATANNNRNRSSGDSLPSLNKGSEMGDFDRALADAITWGLIQVVVSGNGQRMKFSHDTIQQAAYIMIPEGTDETQFRSSVGERVLQLSRDTNDDDDEGWMLFSSAVDLLTRHRPSSSSSSSSPTADVPTSKFSREDLARLCLEVSQRASVKSAFITAASYADRGYSLLLDEPSWQQRWKEQYSLCLELRTLSAEMHHSYGDHKGALEAASDIIEHAVPIEDRFSAHNVLIATRLSQHDMRAAIRDCVTLLRDIGVWFPEKPTMLHVVFQSLKVRRLLKGRRAHDLQDLPLAKDSNIIQATRVLNQMAFAAWRLNTVKFTLLLTCFMTIRLTLRHGISLFSSSAFAYYGGYLSYCGRLNEAHEYGCLALQMQNRLGTRRVMAQTTCSVHYHLWHLKNPIIASLEPLEQAYENGMHAGDVSYAGLCLFVRVILCFHGSMKLDHLETQVREYCSFLREYQIKSSLRVMLPLFQLVLNLRGKSKNALVLSGEAIEDEAEYIEEQKIFNNNGLVHIHYAKMILLVVNDELELADVERRKCPQELTAFSYPKCCNMFFSSLACLGLARRWLRAGKGGKSRYYRSVARKYQKQLGIIVQNGSVNCVPFVKLLDAETLSLRSLPQERIMKAYQDAVVAATRCGFRLCKGLACEKAGRYLLEHGKQQLANDYLQQAWTEFSDYGAFAKLLQMEETYRDYGFSFKGDETTVVSSRTSSITKPHSLRLVLASCR